jgi:hypothetical protein
MSLRNKKTLESFSFATLAELRDWLNQFETTDLSAVEFDSCDWITLEWIEETLSDGSTVNNVGIHRR